MKFTGLMVVCLLLATAGFSQQSIRIRILQAENREPLPGASLKFPGNRISVADTTGIVVLENLQPAKYAIEISHVGFKELKTFILPEFFSQPVIEFLLEPEEEEEEEIIIQSTRSSRTIRDIPTRVEFVAGEELDEKANMKPGDIRMVLNESTGIQTQQTSATSGNSAIRIQGLDGRYTQVLKDGFPVFDGFSGGLGLLQTPPLDLKQFEVIKGSASTLYGGGAIAGLVNLVSKTPQFDKELKFHIDLTSAGGVNSSGFYGKRSDKTGITLFASRNSNKPFDPASIGLTAIPKFERYTINPALYFYLTPRTVLKAGVYVTTENREGGDLKFIRKKKPSGFFENNSSDRISTQLSFDHHFSKNAQVTFRQSYNHFKRIISTNGYVFNGLQKGTFTEAVFAVHDDKTEWIAGTNLVTDHFTETQTTTTPLRDYRQLTAGVFVQNSWRISDRINIESGLRGDFIEDYEFVLLPRVSALFKFSPALSSRIGGGMGYKNPTIFTEESERLLYKNVLRIDENVNKPEHSYGFNADINYKTKLAGGEVDLSINHLFFYTRISDPLLLQPTGSFFRLLNVDGHFDSKGMETNIKAGYKDFKLFLGYTFTKAYLHRGPTKLENFLTPRHRLNSVLLYEVEDKWKIGLEGYYFGRQNLSDGKTGKPYWITGFMVEKLWDLFSVYINFENFLDARQTRFDSIYTGTLDSPVFKDIYAPLDGFVVNGGIKLRF